MKPLHRVIMGAAVFVADIAAFIVRSKFPHLNMANDNMELDTLFSFIIAFIGIMVAVAIVIVQFERQAKQLSEMGEETEIRNRRYLIEYLENQLSQDEKKKHCAVLIDLDLFKSVNDTYGHVFGDNVLKHFAYAVKTNIGENDLIARFGGEEFMILFDTDNIETVMMVMKRIRKSYSEFSEKEKGKEFTFSAGVAVYGSGNSITEIFTTADKRLYKAKAAGRNKIMID